MHAELLAGHKREIEELESSHATSISDLLVQQQGTAEEMDQKVRVLEEKAKAATQETETIKKSLEAAQLKGEKTRTELEAALAEAKAQAKDELARELKKVTILKLSDVLEGMDYVSS